jgi:hypothetical protein
MQRRSPWGFLWLTTALVAAGAMAWFVQWQESAVLRADLAGLQMESSGLDRLRAENTRLRGQQIPAAELERLRADHAALPRLRAEIETLNRPAQAGER